MSPPGAFRDAIPASHQEIRSGADYKASGTIAITSDPAVQLMVYQLAFLCGADIYTAFADVGILRSRVALAIDNMIGGDANLLFSVDEH